MNHHKVAILTGAGGKIGTPIARMLVDEGYALIVNDLDPFRCEGTAGWAGYNHHPPSCSLVASRFFVPCRSCA